MSVAIRRLANYNPVASVRRHNLVVPLLVSSVLTRSSVAESSILFAISRNAAQEPLGSVPMMPTLCLTLSALMQAIQQRVSLQVMPQIASVAPASLPGSPSADLLQIHRRQPAVHPALAERAVLPCIAVAVRAAGTRRHWQAAPVIRMGRVSIEITFAKTTFANQSIASTLTPGR
jgi:hypothetical protein